VRSEAAGYLKNVAGFVQKPPRFRKNAPGFGRIVKTFHFSLITFHFFSGAPGVSKIIPARARVKTVGCFLAILFTKVLTIPRFFRIFAAIFNE